MSVPFGSRTNTEPEEAEVSKDGTTNVTTTFAKLSKEAKHLGATEKENNANQGVTLMP